MAKYLCIVRSAYRATIEEQDDPALWFTHAMGSAGADVSVLLRGDAVSYATKGQDARGLQFGDCAVKGPDIPRDIRSMLDAKIAVYVTREDLSTRGIDEARLAIGIRAMNESAIGELVGGFDRILAF